MNGLCHSCLSSNVELNRINGKLICVDCEHQSYGFKQSPENKDIPNPSFDDLKKKWMR